MLRHIAVLAFLLTLAGCGWQLRGYEQYKADGLQKIEQLHLLTTSDNREFQAILKRQVKDLSIKLSPEAPLKLVLHEEKTERRPLSYGSTGIPVQYQLIMTVRYEFSTPASPIPAERRLTARREYDFDTALVVAKNEEERVLLEEMRNELASRIIASVAEPLVTL